MACRIRLRKNRESVERRLLNFDLTHVLLALNPLLTVPTVIDSASRLMTTK
jgi:hypothetical protein